MDRGLMIGVVSRPDRSLQTCFAPRRSGKGAGDRRPYPVHENQDGARSGQRRPNDIDGF